MNKMYTQIISLRNATNSAKQIANKAKPIPEKRFKKHHALSVLGSLTQAQHCQQLYLSTVTASELPPPISCTPSALAVEPVAELLFKGLVQSPFDNGDSSIGFRAPGFIIATLTSSVESRPSHTSSAAEA